MPVKITITVEQADGTPETRVLVPSVNLTDDGVETRVDRVLHELKDGVTVAYTHNIIEWTEVEYS